MSSASGCSPLARLHEYVVNQRGGFWPAHDPGETFTDGWKLVGDIARGAQSVVHPHGHVKIKQAEALAKMIGPSAAR